MAAIRLSRLVGVVGAGQLGSGIAQVCAVKGQEVILCDTNKDALERSFNGIEKRLESNVRKDRMSSRDAERALDRIKLSSALEDLEPVELAIEAVPEKEDLKKQTFALLDKLTAPSAILASNTSSISITRLAAVTQRPEQVVGPHFMHPVQAMPLVEIIKATQTSEETFLIAKKQAEHLGKAVCVSLDRPGFIINRCLMMMLNEAFFCWMEGTATPEDIDRGMMLGTSHPMGPLQLADFIGLDTCLSVIRTLYTELGDSKYRPCPKLVQLVDAGWVGKKAYKGVYTYAKPV